MRQAQQTNLQLLKSLDEEGISLQDYISMLIEKELMNKGFLQGEDILEVMKEPL
jgi:hypothetical protein